MRGDNRLPQHWVPRWRRTVMEQHNLDSEQQRRQRNKHRRNQWMIASTWVTTLAAFFGFFTIWNHLSSAPATTATSAGLQAAQGSTSFSGTHRRHHDDSEGGDDAYGDDGDGSGGYSGGSSGTYSYSGGNGYSSGSSASGGSGFGGSGSVQVNPGQSSGQFVSRAS